MTIRIGARILMAGVTAAALLALEAPALAQSEQARMTALAREARTVSEHADMARRFRLQAEAFDARAVAHEAEAAPLSRNAPSITNKWPAMVPQALTQAKQQAADARRAAEENRAIADRHLRLAVEAHATTSQPAD